WQPARRIIDSSDRRAKGSPSTTKTTGVLLEIGTAIEAGNERCPTFIVSSGSVVIATNPPSSWVTRCTIIAAGECRPLRQLAPLTCCLRGATHDGPLGV